MHVVTKILVVFCAVLSLLLAALTMAYAANAGEVRSAYKGEEAQKIAAQAAKADLESQVSAKEAEAQANVQAARSMVSAREKEVKDLQAERTELKTQLEQLKATAEGINNRLVQLAAAVDTQAEIIKNYRDEVTKLRDEGLASSKREIDLVDRLNDLQSQLEVTTASARALKEQLAEIQFQGQGGGAKPNEPPFVGALIQARVLDVFKSPAGDTMVTISEGSNRKIQERMQLNITRGNQFIGILNIISVDPTKAVGKVDTLGKPVEVKPQDLVLSRLD